MTTELLRAYRVALDPTPDQEDHLARHVGAARWAYNYALAKKVEAHQAYTAQVEALVAEGTPKDQARKKIKFAIPKKPIIQKEHNRIKHEITPWWNEVGTYAFQSAWADADQAFQNWMDSRSGRRAGPAVGYPRFKKKGRSRDSCRIYGTIRLRTSRRLQIPKIGEIRTHTPMRYLNRRLHAGLAVIKNVTVSRAGSRWYAAILVEDTVELPTQPTQRQQAGGRIGVDLGVRSLATLSTGESIENLRIADKYTKRIRKAQRALARKQLVPTLIIKSDGTEATKKIASKRRLKAQRQLARLQHRAAEHRKTMQHRFTKRLATHHAVVAIEDLAVQAMTASAKGTIDNPGHNVKPKSRLNRRILDVGFHEVRRQLTYKTSWYGSRLAILERWHKSSQTCSGCGQIRKLKLSERTYHCKTCGLTIDRDHNAAINIARHAAVQ
jgi:putative transposase